MYVVISSERIVVMNFKCALSGGALIDSTLETWLTVECGTPYHWRACR